jgi:hypothetical protein
MQIPEHEKSNASPDVASRKVSYASSSVGIFWAIKPPGIPLILLDHRCSLDVAELYGDMLTCPHGHYDIWEEWRKAPTDVQRDARSVVVASEYEEWPRGRVVFDAIHQEFTCYADVQVLRRPSLIATIQQRFGLPIERTKMMWDSHYRSTMLLGS